ncbi:MAG TPA: hypothetical protein VGK12_07205 [Actinomycetota bacterium]
MGRSIHRRSAGIAVMIAIVSASCTSPRAEAASPTPCSTEHRSIPIPQPSEEQMAAAGLADLPTAPDSTRVDLVAPPFTNSTNVTNPLFPIAELRSAVLDGRIDGEPFHTETTLLPYTRIIEWTPGQCVETLVSQYAAFLNGRIQELALDYYAQADDGSVWYFGEDVSDYDRRGVIAFTTDSWLAGRDGPPAMIMPDDPQVGQAFRTENIPGKVFEEVTVKTIDLTVPGPFGPVDGAMVGQELHDDGMTSDKVFAPGYGEFLTRDTDGVEAMAVAVPTDALPGPTPRDLVDLRSGAMDALREAASGNWPAARAELSRMRAAWTRYAHAGTAPVRLTGPMGRALFRLSHAIEAKASRTAQAAGIDVAQAAVDLELPFRPPAEIDVARFQLWIRQLLLDARSDQVGAASGDIAALEVTRDRFSAAIDPVALTHLNRDLLTMREDQVDGNMRAVVRVASDLLDRMPSLEPA